MKKKLMTSRALPLLICAVLTCAVGTSCGGGGNGGGSGSGNAQLSFITIEGVGGTVGPNDLPSEVAVNAAIFFSFLGPVDPASIPADGAADAGSIRITNNANGSGALGTWTIKSDDPNTVVFTAFPPLDSTDPCGGGLASDATYTIFIPAGGGGLQNVINVGGQPLEQSELRTFTVSMCNIVDPNPGLPEIVNITPAADITAPAVDASATETGAAGQSQVIVDFNEPIDPATVSTANISLINTTSASTPLPVALNASTGLVFQQFGTVIGESVARIVLNTAELLQENQVYEIRITGITDLGGNPVTVPAGELLISINDDPATSLVSQSFSDDFDDTTNLLDEAQAVDWNGDGVVTATFPIDVVGTGDDGAGVFNTPITINTDNFNQGMVTTTNGVFDFTSLTINGNDTNGFVLSFSSTTDVAPGESNFAVQIRATGTIDIGLGTTINCDGRPGADGGPANQAGTVSAAGGWGGPGGGAGGIGSPNTDGATPSPFGLSGNGANVDANDINVPGDSQNFQVGSDFFGGGTGGQAGLGPSEATGPGGGGGGAASAFGLAGGYGVGDPPSWNFLEAEDGTGHTGSPQVPGVAGTPPAAFVTPFTDLNPAGSGGGAGGDRVISPSFITTHAAGAAGGGGGGALRMSAGGNINIGDISQFTARGGEGGNSTLPTIGRGGGGSGGSFFLQTFGVISLGNGASFFCDGGVGGSQLGPTSSGNGGRGGDGTVQLEDSDSMTLMTQLASFSIVQAEAVVQDFSFTMDVTGVATSRVIDTGCSSPIYTTATSMMAANGSMVGSATVTIRGVAEDPTNPGQPATTMTDSAGFMLMTPAVPLANVADLSGFRFFQFVINTAFPAPGTGPGAPNIGDPLPAVDSVTVNFQCEQ